MSAISVSTGPAARGADGIRGSLVGPARRLGARKSIHGGALVDGSVPRSALDPYALQLRNRYAAKSLGGSSSTAGGFASFVWDPGQDVTVSVTFASAVAPSGSCYLFGRGGQDTAFVLYVVPNTGNTGSVRFLVNSTDWATSATTLPLFDGVAHTLSARITGTTASLTLDGNLVASGTFTSTTWGSWTYHIGSSAATGAQRFPGAIWNLEGTDHGTAANGFTFLMDEPPTSTTYANSRSGSTAAATAAKGTGAAFPWVTSVVSTDGRGMPWQSQGPLVYAAHRSGTGQVLDGSVAAEYILTFNSEITDPTGSLNHSTGVWTAPAAGVVVPSISFLLDTGGTSDSLAAGFYLAGTVTKNFLWTQPVTTELRNSWVDAITVTAGQTVDFRVYNIAAGNTTLESSYAILQLTFYPTPTTG